MGNSKLECPNKYSFCYYFRNICCSSILFKSSHFNFKPKARDSSLNVLQFACWVVGCIFNWSKSSYPFILIQFSNKVKRKRSKFIANFKAVLFHNTCGLNLLLSIYCTNVVVHLLLQPWRLSKGAKIGKGIYPYSNFK